MYVELFLGVTMIVRTTNGTATVKQLRLLLTAGAMDAVVVYAVFLVGRWIEDKNLVKAALETEGFRCSLVDNGVMVSL